MSKAILTLDGRDPLEGTAEAGGDFIRFRTAGGPGPQDLDRLHKGRIEIDGKAEKVMLKSAQLVQGDGGEGDGGVELTLQRFQPSSV